MSRAVGKAGKRAGTPCPAMPAAVKPSPGRTSALKAVVFAQDKTTKKVLNAVTVEVK